MEAVLRIVQIPNDGVPRPRLFAELTRVEDASDLVQFGHTDLVERPEPREAGFADEDDTRHLLFVAFDSDAELEVGTASPFPGLAGDSDQPVIGYGSADLPLGDNLHLAETYVVVDPAHRGRGFGRALAMIVEHAVQAAGRTTMTTWTAHGLGPDAADPDALEAPTGCGTVSHSDAVTRLAVTLGFTLEQTERHSQLDLPVDPGRLDRLQAEATPRGGGYRVVGWSGRTPEEYVEGMAALHRRMSVDVPSAGLDFEEEAWDAERVRRHDERAERLGKTRLMAAAVHEASGELVAYTTLLLDPRHPEASWQGDTLVHGDHRGHRLGMAIKIANLRRLADTAPRIRRVHTWNAGENEWMLAINVALGFRPVGVEGAWQKRLGAA